MSERTAGILTIGDELLIGQITDTNSTWLGRQLNELCWNVRSKATVADEVQDITQALEQMAEKCQVVIVTGGLGPTSDDRTLEAMSQYFETELILFPEVEQKIRQYFESRGRMLSTHHAKQFYLPKGVQVLPNNVGTAPGMLMINGDNQFYFTPGVPVELHYIFDHHIRPRLQRQNPEGMKQVRLFTAGIGETALVDKLGVNLSVWNSHLKIAYLPYLGGVRLRLTANGDAKDSANGFIQEAQQFIRQRLGDHFISTEFDQWNEIIQHLMIDRKLTLATAESCTGGYIASRITDLPGSSGYFVGSVVSYANEIKRDVLHVDQSTLDQHGAVSRECAIEMLEGVLALTSADIGVAVTGIAGPGGGSEEKPVGTVFVSVGNNKRNETRRFNYPSSRAGIIEYTYHQAMYMVYKFLSTL